MIKKLIPEICPICSTSLIIQEGKGEDVLKLVCPNNKCGGSVIKKLEKGIKVLQVKHIGPATIEKLYKAGVSNCIDLFNKKIVNEDNLIKSGEFKKGRQLEIILNSINSFKEINIEKAIHSMQIEVMKEDKTGVIPIGKSLSLEIGKMLSKVSYDFTGLSKQIRDDLKDLNNSSLYQEIISNLKIFENNNVKIIYFKQKPKSVVKKITKKVCFDTKEDKSIFLNIGWDEVDINEADILIVDDKNTKTDKIEIAIKNKIKILTYKQAKLLFI